MKRLLVQILVVVADIQMRTLKTEVEKGSDVTLMSDLLLLILVTPVTLPPVTPGPEGRLGVAYSGKFTRWRNIG